MRTKLATWPKPAAVLAAVPLALLLMSCTSGSLDSPSSSTATNTANAASQACADLVLVASDIAVLDEANYTSGNVNDLKADLEALSKDVKAYAGAAGDAGKLAAADLGLAAEQLASAVEGLGNTTTTGEVVTALSDLTAAYDAAEIASDC